MSGRVENWSAVQQRIDALVKQHGGLRAAARAIKAEPSHLCRMRSGEKQSASGDTLRKLGFKAVMVVRPIKAVSK